MECLNGIQSHQIPAEGKIVLFNPLPPFHPQGLRLMTKPAFSVFQISPARPPRISSPCPRQSFRAHHIRNPRPRPRYNLSPNSQYDQLSLPSCP